MSGHAARTMPEIPEPVVTVQRVQITCVPGDHHFSLYVEYRGHRDGADWYSVTDGFYPCARTLNRDGEWRVEQKPYSHSPSWRVSRQFPLHEAIEVARKHAPKVTVNGFTVTDGLRMKERREGRDV